jgi:DNA-binding GntR family transcriptional regulator
MDGQDVMTKAVWLSQQNPSWSEDQIREHIEASEREKLERLEDEHEAIKDAIARRSNSSWYDFLEIIYQLDNSPHPAYWREKLDRWEQTDPTAGLRDQLKEVDDQIKALKNPDPEAWKMVLVNPFWVERKRLKEQQNREEYARKLRLARLNPFGHHGMELD